MINQIFVKPVLFLVVGAAFLALAFYIFAKPQGLAILGKKGGQASLESQVKKQINKTEEETAKSLTRTILEKVLPAAAESPLFGPVKRASEDVGEAAESIKSLPEDQKSAICRQICGP